MAGWNQNCDDWRTLLAVSAGGGRAVEHDGAVVGTALGLEVSPGLGWLSMVLVDPGYRRRGIATTVVAAVLQHLHGLGCTTVMLDATASGARVYRSLGFAEAGSITRLRRGAPVEAAPRPEHRSVWVDTPLDELDRVADIDRMVTHVDRSPVLRALLATRDVRLRVLEVGSELVGYGIVRRGRTARHLGPVVAARPCLATELAVDVIQSIDTTMIVDVVDGTPVMQRLPAAGFETERQFLRMSLGAPQALEPGVAATAGPEWG